MSTKTEQIKVRVSEEEKEALRKAAAVSGMAMSEIVLAPALREAHRLIAELSLPQTTTMPRASFDSLMASLDEPDEVTQSSIEAIRRLRDDGQWDLD